MHIGLERKRGEEEKRRGEHRNCPLLPGSVELTQSHQLLLQTRPGRAGKWKGGDLRLRLLSTSVASRHWLWHLLLQPWHLALLQRNLRQRVAASVRLLPQVDDVLAIQTPSLTSFTGHCRCKPASCLYFKFSIRKHHSQQLAPFHDKCWALGGQFQLELYRGGPVPTRTVACVGPN